MLNEQRNELGQMLNDAQASGDSKYGTEVDPAAVDLHASIHLAVAMATKHGHSRREIEQRALLGKSTLDDYLSCKPFSIMKIDQFARILMDPNVLGNEGHKMLLTEIAVRNGFTVIKDENSREADGMLEEALDVADATGALAETVRKAIDVDSPGGTRITYEEQIEIGANGRVVMEEAMQMIPSVENGAR